MRRDVRINGLAIDGSPPDNSHHMDMSIKLRDILRLFRRHYLLFVGSLILCAFVAFFYIKSAPNVYLRYASIMIKDSDQVAAGISPLRDLGIEIPSQNVTNEIMLIKSRDVAQKVVRRLDLDIEYRREGWFYNTLVYKDELPINLLLHNNDDATFSCVIELLPDSMVTVRNIFKDGAKYEGHFTIKLSRRYSTVLGDITIYPTPIYSNESTETLIVCRRSIMETTETLVTNIDANLRSRDATIIDIFCTDESALRAEDIIKAIVDEYNARCAADQNSITESTDKFVTERIATIEKELNIVEATLAGYRSANLTLDAGAQGEKALYRVEEANDRLTEIDNQIYMIEYMRAFISDPDHSEIPLPLNTGITSPSIEHYLAEYNTVMHKRNTHLSHSSEQNPIVSDLTEKLMALRSTIIQTIDNELIRLSNEYEKVEDRKLDAMATVANTPHQTIYLTSIERQKQVKENLYVFLLQKKEENDLSQTYTAYNCRIIEPPHGPSIPISPIPGKACLLALLAGLLIPASILVVRDGINMKVRKAKDLANDLIPLLGELPYDKKIGKYRQQKSKGRIFKERHGKVFAVKRNSTDAMNDAFRSLRTNLEFALSPNSENGKIVMVTSAQDISGKTFVATNLALSLALTEKRVALVDLDMRKGNISKRIGSPSSGVSTYLSGKSADWSGFLVRLHDVDMLPCGPLPHNPTELLHKDNFSILLNTLKATYDYVLIDCPTMEIVADAMIISRYADMTLMVVRANLFDRPMLHEVVAWQATDKYGNLAFVLNATLPPYSVRSRHT